MACRERGAYIDWTECSEHTSEFINQSKFIPHWNVPDQLFVSGKTSY